MCDRDKVFGGLLESMQENLDDLVKMVRHDLEPLHRITIGTMIVLDVRNKDVVLEMQENKINDVTNF